MALSEQSLNGWGGESPARSHATSLCGGMAHLHQMCPFRYSLAQKLIFPSNNNTIPYHEMGDGQFRYHFICSCTPTALLGPRPLSPRSLGRRVERGQRRRGETLLRSPNVGGAAHLVETLTDVGRDLEFFR